VKALHKFLALQWKQRLLLLEAWLYLGAVRAALLIISFKHISRYLGQQLPAESAALPNAPTTAAGRQVGWAVAIMARHTPWESACLAQSIAGKFMLKRRGVSSRLSLGMKKDAAGQLTAHAWLQEGNEVLLGGVGHDTFVVLSTFGDPEG
jgi:hypothetical protein